jgi:hypothetical protein
MDSLERRSHTVLHGTVLPPEATPRGTVTVRRVGPWAIPVAILGLLVFLILFVALTILTVVATLVLGLVLRRRVTVGRMPARAPFSR